VRCRHECSCSAHHHRQLTPRSYPDSAANVGDLTANWAATFGPFCVRTQTPELRVELASLATAMVMTMDPGSGSGHSQPPALHLWLPPPTTHKASARPTLATSDMRSTPCFGGRQSEGSGAALMLREIGYPAPHLANW
jgi:hypothetical protein